MQRRQFLVAVGGTGLALTLGGGYWYVSRPPSEALQPWDAAGSDIADDRLFAFAHAILAPNPHNIQPWLIRLDGSDGAVLLHDPTRHLAKTDPFDRQLTIGHGCFLELTRIAASERGCRLEIDHFPEGSDERGLDARPVAALRFIKDNSVKRDPLFAHIVRRCSDKGNYSDRPLESSTARLVAGKDMLITDADKIGPLRAAILEGVRIEMQAPAIHRETVGFMRIGRNEANAQPDGIALLGPMVESLRLAGVINRKTLADPDSMAFQSGLDMMLETYASIPALLAIKTPHNSRLDQIEAGRRYVRANLRATARGVSMHPMSQTLQEYPQMASLLRQVHDLLGAEGGERVQMLARIGYPVSTPSHTPRWPLETRIVT